MKKTTNEQGNEQRALLNILQRAITFTTNSVYYTLAFLGAVAILPGIPISPEYSAFVGLAVEAMAGLIEKYTINPNMSEKELKNEIQKVLSRGQFDSLLTEEKFFNAYSQLLEKDRKSREIAKEILKGIRDTKEQVTNIQSELVSPSSIRQIAQDVFLANFPELVQEGRNTANKRVSEFNELFFEKMLETNKMGFQALQDPGFQFNLYKAQEHFARQGGLETKMLLVDLLIERAFSLDNSILKIAQDEAIATIPKLLPAHFKALSIYFLIQYIGILDKDVVSEFVYGFEEYLEYLFLEIPEDVGFFSYLSETGCVRDKTKKENRNGYYTVANIGYMNPRFTLREKNLMHSSGLLHELLLEENKGMYCVIGKYQNDSYIGSDWDQVTSKLTTIALSDEEKAKILSQYERISAYRYQVDNPFYSELLELINPKYGQFVDVWHELMEEQTLTLKGMIMAISFLKIKYGSVFNVYKYSRGPST